MQHGNVTPPAWSGQFWEQPEEGRGFMSVHISDARDHPLPDGYEIESIEVDGVAEVFTYRKIQSV
jgi:hypothetical protein